MNLIDVRKMKLSQAQEKSLSSTDDAAADPFATDIFAEPRADNPEPNSGAEKPGWTRPLRKIARRQVDWEFLQRGLPTDIVEELPRRLAESLSGYLDPNIERLIEFLPIANRETNGLAENGMAWWVRVAVENSDAELAIEVDDTFAVWLVDAALGEIGEKFPIRVLTPSEVAVLEFLAVNLAHEANTIVNAPLFSFRSLGRKSPDWARPEGDDANRVLVVPLQGVHGFRQSVVKLCLTPEVLKAMQAGENKLLCTSTRRAVIWKSLASRVDEVRARIFLGDVRATLAEVAGLEVGDVVLPENHGLFTADRNLHGRALIFLGDGENVRIVGTLQRPETAAERFEVAPSESDNKKIIRKIKTQNPLDFRIERVEDVGEILIVENSTPQRDADRTSRTDDTIADRPDGISLENLAVTLRVELEARRLSLAEVADLRVDQVIELGTRASDPVNLLIDGKVVARGELVEVEENLGVRVIQILR